MTVQDWLTDIDAAFEDGDYAAMGDIIGDFIAEYEDDDKAMAALEYYLNDPAVQNDLPYGFPY